MKQCDNPADAILDLVLIYQSLEDVKSRLRDVEVSDFVDRAHLRTSTDVSSKIAEFQKSIVANALSLSRQIEDSGDKALHFIAILTLLCEQDKQKAHEFLEEALRLTYAVPEDYYNLPVIYARLGVLLSNFNVLLVEAEHCIGFAVDLARMDESPYDTYDNRCFVRVAIAVRQFYRQNPQVARELTSAINLTPEEMKEVANAFIDSCLLKPNLGPAYYLLDFDFLKWINNESQIDERQIRSVAEEISRSLSISIDDTTAKLKIDNLNSSEERLLTLIYLIDQI